MVAVSAVRISYLLIDQIEASVPDEETDVPRHCFSGLMEIGAAGEAYFIVTSV